MQAFLCFPSTFLSDNRLERPMFNLNEKDTLSGLHKTYT